MLFSSINNTDPLSVEYKEQQEMVEKRAAWRQRL